MTRVAGIARNIVTNWFGFVISAAITLLLTPIVLNELGPSRYGIWILTSSIVGYYGILDLGFRAGLTQYLTRYISIEKFDVASEYLSSAVVAMGGFAAIVVVLSVGGAFISPLIFDIPEELVSEAFWCILIVGIGSATQFALFPFAAIFPAAERFDIANYIGIATRLIGAACVLLALKLDYGLIGVSAATFFANFVDYLLRWRISLRIVPQLYFTKHRIVFSRLKDIMSFGVWNFFISLNMYAHQHAPSIIIATFLRLPAVGHYSLATGLMQQISSLLMPVGQVLYPVAVSLNAQGDKVGLKRLYHDGTRMMMIMMISIVLTAGFLAEDFYRLWVGEQYLSSDSYHSVALLLQVLLGSTFTSYTATVGIEILKGAGHIRIMSLALICGTALNILLSLILVHDFGLLGIAIAVVSASAIIDFIVVPVLVQRIMGLSVREWIRHGCIRALLVGVADAVLLTIGYEYVQVDSWGSFLLAGFASVSLCTLSAVSFGMNGEERERFITQRLRTLAFR